MNPNYPIFIFIGIAIISLVATLLFTPLVIKLSHRLDVLDKPGTRRIHLGVIPRMGGLAIFGGLIVGLAAFYLFDSEGFQILFARGYITILGGSFVMMVLGFIDDKYGLSARVKFPVQFLTAGVMIALGVKIVKITNPFGGVFDLGLLSYPVTLLWIVGVTNAINLSDGLDGLATGISLIVAITMFAVSLVTLHPGTLIISAALSGALIGFLKYNFNPARIFMGDTGSQFLGFLLATLSIKGSLVSSTTAALVIPLIALGLPIFDTLFAFLRRLLTGHNPFSADKMHVHHRLLSFGFNQRQVVIMLYTVCVIFGVIAFTLTAVSNQTAGGLLIVFGVIIYIGIRRLGYMESILVRMKKKRYSDKRKIYHALYVEPEQNVPLWLKILSKKRVFEILLDGFFIAASFFLARVILEDWATITMDLGLLRDQLIIVCLCCYACFFSFGFYREMWRYIDLNAIGKYVKGVIAAVLSGYFAFAVLNPELTVTPKEMVVFWLLLILAISSSRVLYNFFSTYQKRELTRITKNENVLIYGAGDRGATVLSSLIKEDNLDYRPIGFIDDDPGKINREILGYKILGDISGLENIVMANDVQRIIISSQYINGMREGTLKDVCKRHKVKLCHFTVRLDNIPLES